MIWDLLEWGHESVQPSDLARKAQVKPSTVTGAINRLVTGGYAQHDPYGAITLTEQGERYAVQMVRKHRLLETFLVTTLGYGWEEVHPEADTLEHAASDLMIDRIDDLLGHPQTDPHGDPIPRRDGSLPCNHTRALSDITADTTVRVERVSDENPELLRMLNDHGIGLHSMIQLSHSSTGPTVQIRPAAQDDSAEPTDLAVMALGAEDAERIRVSA